MAANTTWNQYETARQFSFVYLIIIGVLGIVSNLLVFVVFIKHDKIRTATNLFILNLALCDLVVSVLDSALSIPSTYTRRWMFGRKACVCYGFLHYFCISVTVSTLAAISIDRFFYITKPAQIKSRRITKSRALTMLVIIYIYVLLFTFPPLAGWSSFTTEEQFFSGCYINYGDQDPASIGYSVIASTFLFLMPLSVMIFCYAKIYTTVRTSTHKTIARALGPSSTPATMRRKYPLFKRTHVQTAKMIFVVIFFCVIVWLPFVVVSLIKAFTGDRIISPLASHITILITKSCVVYNVLIYVVLNRKLKAAMIDLVCCGRLPRCLASSNNNNLSNVRVSRMLSACDHGDMTTEVVRKRLSTIATTEKGSDGDKSSDVPSPNLRKDAGVTNAGLLESPSPMIKDGQVRSVDFMDENSSGVGATNQTPADAPQTKSIQLDSDTNEKHILSFTCLRDEKNKEKKKQLSDSVSPKGASEVTRVEAQRRALRKMNQKEAGIRKLPPLPVSNILQNHEDKSESKSNSPSNVLHSRENSYSTAIPSSNNSTCTSETSLNTSAKDDSSIDVSPRSASSTSRHRVRKPRTIGYRGGRNALLRERLKHSTKDPLCVSSSELEEIQTYWKRMSLCLDEINIDEEAR